MAMNSLTDCCEEASELPSRDYPMKRVVVELANTPSKRERGLMFRHELDPDSGMAFVFDSPSRHGFWGMNTFIPLDIAFVNSDNKIVHIGRIKPHDLNSVAPSEPCHMAVELPDGWMSANGFREGDDCHLVQDENPPCCVFSKNFKTAQVKPESSVPPQDISADDVPEAAAQETPSAKPAAPQDDVAPTPRPGIESENARSGADSSVSLLEIPQFGSLGDAVKWAVENQQVMNVEYRTKSGKQINRFVEPHGLAFSEKSRRNYMVAHDETVGGPRDFILNRIVRFSFPGRTFTKKFVVS